MKTTYRYNYPAGVATVKNRERYWKLEVVVPNRVIVLGKSEFITLGEAKRYAEKVLSQF